MSDSLYKEQLHDVVVEAVRKLQRKQLEQMLQDVKSVRL